MVLEPPQQGQPINMFDLPIAEVDGKPFAGVRWFGHYQDLPLRASSQVDAN